MTGYTRQSTADIIPTATVRAAPLNAEYNAIRDAFAASGGHKHDGTTGEGDYVPLIADLDAVNKVVVDTANNRVSIYTEVSGASVEQVRFQDGAIVPVTDDDIDLGATGAEFKDLYIDGVGYIDSVVITGGTIDGTVIGGTTPAAADFTTMDASGDATVGGTLDVTGDTTVDNLTATGTTTITSGDINSGAMDGTTIGASTPAAGTFTSLTANTSLTAATADINGGTIDNATIGATTPSTGAFTTISTSGQATLASADINGGSIDGATIGATSHTSGKFSTLQSTGNATLATADINGGTIDGTSIGSTTASSGAFTTVSATGGITGDLTGDVTGNVTGNVTGAITGNVTGNLTGNVTSSGTSTFNNVTIDGTLNMNAGTTATITNLTTPTNANDAATKGYVDTSVADLVDAAPGTLDTLNELAAALNDDPNFSTTITNSIATKLPLAGGTMSGAIAMGGNKVTGVTDPTAAQDAATKAYVDQQDGLQVSKSGDSMSGNLAMGSNKVTGLAAPTDANDATSKTYVDGILGSATAAAASASAAATSESNAATSETNAANSAASAAADLSSVQSLYDQFDDRYLGSKASAPTVDNDGNALLSGALYFNTTTNLMYVYGGSGWVPAGSSVNGTSDRVTYTASAGQTVFAATYDAGYVDVYLNGVKLVDGSDFTATNGTSVVLTTGAAINDIVDVVAYGTFTLADHYTKTQTDARYVEVAGDTMTGNLSFGDNDKAIFGAGSDLQIYHSGSHSYITDTGTGSLYIRASDFVSVQAADGTNSIVADTDSEVTLYHNGSQKLATTSTGIDVTGNVKAGKITADSSGTIEVFGYGMSSLSNGDGYKTVRSINGLDGYNYYAGLYWQDDLKLKTTDSGINVSGNLLVGKSNTLLANAGVAIYSDPYKGLVEVTRDGGQAMILNRKTSDGTILDLRKDSSAVGSIGTYGNTAFIQSGSGASYSGLLFNTSQVEPTRTLGGTGGDPRTDNELNLGSANYRFKDLYLSGGVYLGGTGSANKLDDYEEGTWTPALGGATSDPTVSYTSRAGYYTKVGNMVYVQFFLNFSSVSGGTGGAIINGLPFAASSGSLNYATHSLEIDGATDNSIVFSRVNGGQSYVLIYKRAEGGDAAAYPTGNLVPADYVLGSITYRTNA